jgi:hypothetical protein
MTRTNLDWWFALCRGSDQIVSNVKKKKECSGNAIAFKEEMKI